MAKGLTGLAHIGVRVSDMKRSLEFYVNELGMELVDYYDRGGTLLGFVQAGTCILELICSPKVDVSALKAGRVAIGVLFLSATADRRVHEAP